MAIPHASKLLLPVFCLRTRLSSKESSECNERFCVRSGLSLGGSSILQTGLAGNFGTYIGNNSQQNRTYGWYLEIDLRMCSRWP